MPKSKYIKKKSMDKKKKPKQKKNSKIPHGTPLVEDDEFIEEVLNYLLNKSGA